MNISKPLKSVLLLENLLLLFRNWSYSSIKIRTFMFLFMLCELILTMTNCIICGLYPVFNVIGGAMYFYSSCGIGIFYLCSSMYTSKLFCKLLITLNTNDRRYMKNEMYLKNLERYSKATMIVFIICACMKIGFLILFNAYENLKDFGFSLILPTVLQAHVALVDLRYVYEYFFLCFLLYIISEQLDCIVRSAEEEKTLVSMVWKMTGSNVCCSNPAAINRLLNGIKELSLLYRGVVEATNLFNTIFGIQMLVMLLSTIAFITTIIYTVISKNIHGCTYFMETIGFVIEFAILAIMILLLSRAAQKVGNNVVRLKQQIACILIYSQSQEECYQATKRLLQLVNCTPMQIKAFGSITVDMSLPPSCIIAFTTYAVIALQFNNVL